MHAPPEERAAAGSLHHRLHQPVVAALNEADLVVRAVVMARIEFVAEAITPVVLEQPTEAAAEAFLQQTTALIWQAVHRNMQRHREQHETP